MVHCFPRHHQAYRQACLCFPDATINLTVSAAPLQLQTWEGVEQGCSQAWLSNHTSPTHLLCLADRSASCLDRRSLQTFLRFSLSFFSRLIALQAGDVFQRQTHILSPKAQTPTSRPASATAEQGPHRLSRAALSSTFCPRARAMAPFQSVSFCSELPHQRHSPQAFSRL